MLISGIIDDRLREVEQTLESRGFALIEKQSSADWNALAFRKKGGTKDEV